MELKLFDSELKVMGVLWREGEATAKRVASVLAEEVGWNRNTTYTLLKRCIQKGAVERLPGAGVPGGGAAGGDGGAGGQAVRGLGGQAVRLPVGTEKTPGGADCAAAGDCGRTGVR